MSGNIYSLFYYSFEPLRTFVLKSSYWGNFFIFCLELGDELLIPKLKKIDGSH